MGLIGILRKFEEQTAGLSLSKAVSRYAPPFYAPFDKLRATVMAGATMRLIFMGTPDFAVPTLNALVDAGHDVVAVYSQPPRPANRGKKLTPSAVHARAEELELEVRTPVSLKGEDEQAAFSALNADAAIVAAYGLLLPQPILDAPKYG